MITMIKYIYIHKDKVEVYAKTIYERFDEQKISVSIRTINDLYGFSFIERNIIVTEAEFTVMLYFNYGNKNYVLFLGLDNVTNTRKLTNILNLHYINDIKNSFLFIDNNSIHTVQCSSIQACFSFWDIDVVFEGVLFIDDLEFYGAYFYKSVRFIKCEFEGNLYCRYTKFFSEVICDLSIFHHIVIFDSCVIYYFSLKDTIFKEKLILINTNKLLDNYEETRVKYAIFGMEIENGEIDSLPKLKSYLLNYVNGEKNYDDIANEFLILNKLYKNRNLYQEEDYTFYYFRKYKMKSMKPSMRKGVEAAYCYIGGYGTKLNRIIITCLIFIGVFFVIYLILQSILIGFSFEILSISMKLSIETFFSFGNYNSDAPFLMSILPLIYIEQLIGQILLMYFTICFSRKAFR